MTRNFDSIIARMAVTGYDSTQKIRKSQMNRVRDLIRKKRENIPFDEVEEEKEDRSFDSEYEDENLAGLIDEMRSEGELSQSDYDYLISMLEVGSLAKQMESKFQSVMEIVEREQIYQDFLQHVYGIGTILSARLVHNLGYCEDFAKTSNLWSYCGMAPDSERERGESLDFSPDAKQVAWLAANNMMRQGSNSLYRTEFYDPYKRRQTDRMKTVEGYEQGVDYEIRQMWNENETHKIDSVWGIRDTEDWERDELLFRGTPPESDGHAHARALRYLAKKFLKHYWYHSRSMIGASTPDVWIVTHGGHHKEEDSFENPEYALDQITS